ncbi:MAG: MFS transporter [Chloroflexi bacterium]|nr:MFS transporter [Chloroflexota bacterium]
MTRMSWRARWSDFPSQFWLLVGGMFLSSAGTSMVWPFLALYISGRLQVPLAQVGALITLQAAAGVIGTLLAGPLVDLVGRKTGIVLSLAGMAVGYVGLAFAEQWWDFALFMALGGLFAPAYRIGGDAMVADMVPPQKRDRAYAVLRTAGNAGIAIGPALGGWLLVHSYRLAFYAAAASLLFYALLLQALARETRPDIEQAEQANITQGLRELLRDRRLLAFLAAALFTWMAAGLMWIYLGVYMRDQYGLAEDKYRWLITTNAILVVLGQYGLTEFMRRFSPRLSMVLGSLLYAGAVLGVLAARSFWDFWFLMVIMTFGEMMLVPAASTWVANLAPPHLRGRYMSTMAFMWAVGAGLIAPLGGWLNDAFSPRAPWIFGAGLAALGALLFALQTPPNPNADATPPAAATAEGSSSQAPA